MLSALTTATSGLEVNQTALDVTANDIANVNTVGFKGAVTSFQDALQQQDASAASPSTYLGGTNAEQVGLGVSVNAITNNMTAGSVQQTGNPLDVAVQGNGFFRIGPATSIGSGTGYEYTRAGNFSLDANGNLVTPNGDYVVGYAYNAGTKTFAQTTANETKITVPSGGTDVSIGADGVVTYTDNTGTVQQLAQISLATFPNDNGLENQAGNVFVATPNSGVAINSVPANTATGTGTLESGSLEMSNVDLAREFTSMITAQQGYQANARVMTTADQLLQTLVTLGQG